MVCALFERTNIKVGSEVELDIIPEVCCEVCGNIIHNHLKICPVCLKQYTSTDQYDELGDVTIIECENCGASFEKIEGSWFFHPRIVIKALGKNLEMH